jgi:hypothetical protein
MTRMKYWKNLKAPVTPEQNARTTIALRLLRPAEQRAALDRFAGAEHEKQLATFRDLADTFGMRPGQMVLNPIQRADSDRMLIDLVTSTLSGFPADVVRRAVEASLLKAEAQRLSDLQDGSAGKRRGGIGRLSGYLLSLLRPVANDLMRQEDANEARNRSEKEVHKRRHATHLSSVQARSGRSAQHSMAEAVRAAFAAPNTGGET